MEIVFSEIFFWVEAVIIEMPGELGIVSRRQLFRMTLAGMGAGCRFKKGLQISHKNGLRLGHRVTINTADINAKAGITIGDDCLIASGVKIWSINHVFRDMHQPIASQGYDLGEIVIGDDVWLASNAVILPGVTIGDGAVVGAGAVVTKDVPPYSIAVGVPARVVGTRESKTEETRGDS